MIFVCIASGPSLTQADVDYCRDKAKVVVVNDNWRKAPWANWLYAADHRWWISAPVGYNEPNWLLTEKQFSGLRVTCDPGTAEKFGFVYVPHQTGAGLAPAPHVRGTLSGIEAINFAANMGASKILLLGYDMGATGTAHWFGDHPDTVAVETPHGVIVEPMNTITPAQFSDACTEVAVMARGLRDAGIEVINCTRQTALTCFPRMAIQEAL